MLAPARLCERLRADLERRGAGDVEDGNADLLAQDLELLDRGRPLHVGSDEQGVLAFLLQQARELGAGGRLAGALQAHHHDARRLPLRREREGRAVARRHEGDELVVADLDEDLPRRDLDGLAFLALRSYPNDLAEGLPRLTRSKEGLDDAELDVSLEQRKTDLAQRRFDVLLGQLGQAREAVPGRFEPFGEGVEHGWAVGLAQVVDDRTAR